MTFGRMDDEPRLLVYYQHVSILEYWIERYVLRLEVAPFIGELDLYHISRCRLDPARRLDAVEHHELFAFYFISQPGGKIEMLAHYIFQFQAFIF